MKKGKEKGMEKDVSGSGRRAWRGRELKREKGTEKDAR